MGVGDPIGGLRGLLRTVPGKKAQKHRQHHRHGKSRLSPPPQPGFRLGFLDLLGGPVQLHLAELQHLPCFFGYAITAINEKAVPMSMATAAITSELITIQVK